MAAVAPGAADLMHTIGFEKSKIGSGDKEVGYQIKESSLSSLFGSLFLCFLVMGAVVVVMVYDVRLEKKTLHRQVRHVEHHAASKLAQVQMELWSQYRDDVLESKEASSLLKHLEGSYNEFQGKFQSSVNDLAKELNLNQERAATFAEKILHLVAEMQQDNVKHAKHLLDHLVKQGKRGHTLEKHVDKDMLKNVKEEADKIEEDGGVPPEDPEAEAAEEGEAHKDPLEAVLKGFWETFKDYDREFGSKVRENFKKGGDVYDQIKDIQKKILGENAPSEEEIGALLDKVDLASVGAPLGQGRILPIQDIVEELVMVPSVPMEKLRTLNKEYESGKVDTVSVFSTLENMHDRHQIPSGWLQMGVNQDEKEEEIEEETLEKSKHKNAGDD